MRRIPLVLTASALLLLAGSPHAEAGKLTPEQKRGVKLIKKARTVGRSFRKAQGSANRAFIRASRRIAKDVNRGRTSAARGLSDWVVLYESVLRDRIVRRTDAYAKYEALYESSELRRASFRSVSDSEARNWRMQPTIPTGSPVRTSSSQRAGRSRWRTSRR